MLRAPRRAQELARLAVAPTLAACSALVRPHLDGFRARLPRLAGRDDDQRGARFRARFNRATTLYPVGPRTRTMMQSCASAAKLRSGGPILPIGIKAKGQCRGSATSNRHRCPSQAYGQGRNFRGAFSVLRFIVPDAKRRRPAQRPAAQAATGRSEACAPGPRSWACEYREPSRCELETTALRRFPSGI